MADFNELQKTADQMQEEFQRVAAEFQTKMQGMFSDMTKSFFDAAPEIKAVIWSQYTPYFNDGEECVFSVNEINFLTEFGEDAELPSYVYDLNDDELDGITVFPKGANQSNLDYYKSCIGRYGSDKYYEDKVREIEEALANPNHARTAELCAGLERVINQNEELMKAIFGDHVIVVLTPDGARTEEASHD